MYIQFIINTESAVNFLMSGLVESVVKVKELQVLVTLETLGSLTVLFSAFSRAY